ncbi:hypothetical protein [Spirosoma areae]
MFRSLLLLLLTGLCLFGCKRSDPETDPVEAKIERISRMTVFYADVPPGPANVAMDTVNGKVYTFIASDDHSFRYDSRNRLINHVLTQTSATDKELFTFKNQYSYGYANGRMTETQTNDGGTRTYSFLLDSTQSRVLTYTKRMQGDNAQLPNGLDTLRQYSADGILKGVVKASGRQVITIDQKNITRIDEYSRSTGNLDNTRTFVYDLDYYSPPAYLTFLGETSRNALVKKTANYGSSGSSNTYVSTYQNSYDASKRLIRQVEFSQYPGQAQVVVSTLTKYYY